jgi:DNA-binding winged helix-turn-helix (wHTH) protein
MDLSAKRLEFDDGAVIIDLGEKTIERKETPHRLSPDLWKWLFALLERSPKMVTYKDFQLVFGQQTVAAHHKHAERLRVLLDDTAKSERFIKSIRGYGYAFIAAPSNIIMNETVTKTSNNEKDANPVLQQVRWGPVDGKPPGICIASCVSGSFVPWDSLKPEVEKMLLPQVRRVPIGSIIALRNLVDRVNWVVRIIDPNGSEIGDVWFGTNADAKWQYDGLVRLGESFRHSDDEQVVWQTFGRFSDGSYRRISQNR